MIQSADAIERSVHKTNEWLSELTDELGEDRDEAWRALKGYLQVLRDRLTTDEAAQLAAQLPMVVRGGFYEGFDPTRQPVKLRTRQEFLSALVERAQPADATEAERSADAVTGLLERHITEGEMEDVFSQLPRELREALQHH
jgi:uncharacterized protein (DUF2267 family)